MKDLHIKYDNDTLKIGDLLMSFAKLAAAVND